MSKCDCGCSPAPKFVFACSGAADVGEVADQAARALTREGNIKMFCLAGIGGRVSGIVKSTEAADKIVAIDGCPLNCALKTLEEAGFTNFDHVELNGLGLKKGESPASPENINVVVKKFPNWFRGKSVHKQIAILTFCLILLGASLAASSDETAAPNFATAVSASDLISGKPQQLPIAGMVTMVDIGAHSCIPCKMMTPIIEELSKKYEGRAAIAFIDVWEYREEAEKYGISAIPTQIFYDTQGKEQYRHVGFLDKESIVAKLTELGIK